MDVTAIYWHFMDALWIYIFFLLLTYCRTWHAETQRHKEVIR